MQSKQMYRHVARVLQTLRADTTLQNGTQSANSTGTDALTAEERNHDTAS